LLFNAAPGYQGNEGRYARGVAQTRDFPVHQRLHFACIATSLFSESSHGGVVGLWQRSVCIHVDQWLYPIRLTSAHSIPLDFLLRCGGVAQTDIDRHLRKLIQAFAATSQVLR
jgi:hypothetical protein